MGKERIDLINELKKVEEEISSLKNTLKGVDSHYHNFTFIDFKVTSSDFNYKSEASIPVEVTKEFAIKMAKSMIEVLEKRSNEILRELSKQN